MNGFRQFYRSGATHTGIVRGYWGHRTSSGDWHEPPLAHSSWVNNKGGLM
jgi:hypothetical protein